MPAMLMLLAALVAAAEPASPPQAVRAPALESPDRLREQATNQSLLAALRVRRSEIARLPLAANDERRAEARRYALEFLDRQIETLSSKIEH